MPFLMNIRKPRLQPARFGFTLIELLLVISITGVMLAVVLPRGVRVRQDAKFAQVRQDASEIASYVVKWGELQSESQRSDSPYSTSDFYSRVIDSRVAGLKSEPLVNHYTGAPAFDGIEAITPEDNHPRNPFNEVSYFREVNNDIEAPSKKPGLLYFVSGLQTFGNRNQRLYYFIFTGVGGRWHGQMNSNDLDGIRRGVFVTRHPESVKEVLNEEEE